ncbi:MAG: DUF3718 domain-containing protein [Gammaproteobacteria bacterium]|nr:DUF3718 domain-containing protein [Gammaproteobacteria bacterium]
MKKFIIGLFSSSFIFCLSITPAKADEDLLRLAISLCDFAKTDDRSQMRRKLKAAGMRLRAIYPAIQCGSDGSLLRVATLNNAFDAAKFLVSKAGVDSLTTPGADGKTLIQFTEELIAGGDASKQQFLDLYKSKL